MEKREELIKELFKNVSIKDCYANERENRVTIEDEKTFDIFFTKAAPIILNETVFDMFSNCMLELKLIACKYNTELNKFAYKFEVVNSYVEIDFE